MVFMADVSTPCEACGGKRYRDELLEVEYRGLNIHDVLQLTVDEAIRFFLRQDRVGEALWQLQRVGLGYLRLGQPATTLSGGEAQRLKVARELAGASGSGRRLYILDEPTVGLGLGEVGQLVRVLDELVVGGAHGRGGRARPGRGPERRLDPGPGPGRGGRGGPHRGRRARPTRSPPPPTPSRGPTCAASAPGHGRTAPPAEAAGSGSTIRRARLFRKECSTTLTGHPGPYVPSLPRQEDP